MPDEDVNVSIATDHLARFDEVVRRLERAGLRVQQRLHAIGIVSGSIDAGKIESLERLTGVSGVERSRSIQIPPPDSDVT